jgi:2-oxoglutarate ferredoxin oxidoreductase subunit beta
VHLRETLEAAARQQGSAFGEVYQNCNFFNDKALAHLTDKEARDETMVTLEHGKPLVYGKAKDRGIRLNGTALEEIRFADGYGPDDCLIWGGTLTNPTIAFIAAQMRRPELPTPLGVLRRVDAAPFEQLVVDQIQRESERKGVGDLARLPHAGDTWKVREDGTIA